MEKIEADNLDSLIDWLLTLSVCGKLHGEGGDSLGSLIDYSACDRLNGEEVDSLDSLLLVSMIDFMEKRLTV
jgi:hypothetical protein